MYFRLYWFLCSFARCLLSCLFVLSQLLVGIACLLLSEVQSPGVAMPATASSRGLQIVGIVALWSELFVLEGGFEHPLMHADTHTNKQRQKGWLKMLTSGIIQYIILLKEKKTKYNKTWSSFKEKVRRGKRFCFDCQPHQPFLVTITTSATSRYNYYCHRRLL